MQELRVTESSGVTLIRVPKNTKFTIMPFYRMGRAYSNHKDLKTARLRVRKLITEKIEFIIFDSKHKVVNLRDFLYD